MNAHVGSAECPVSGAGSGRVTEVTEMTSTPYPLLRRESLKQ